MNGCGLGTLQFSCGRTTGTNSVVEILGRILEVDKSFMKTPPFNSSFVCFWNVVEERKPFANRQLIGKPHDLTSSCVIGICRNVFVYAFTFGRRSSALWNGGTLGLLLQLRSAENPNHYMGFLAQRFASAPHFGIIHPPLSLLP